MKNLTKKHDNGFTLVEVMVAVLVLTIGLLGAAGMQISAINGNADASNLTEATILAHDMAETILSWDYPDPVNDPLHPLADDNDTAFQRMDYQVAGMIDVNGVPSVADNSLVSGDYTVYWNAEPIMDAGAPPQEIARNIRVDVVWNENSRLKTVTVDHVKTRF